MSYGIVRVQKMTKGALQGMQIHNQREKEYSHTNTDIDFLKSNKNYDLKNNQDISYHQRTKEIISESYTGTRAIRKDAVMMCECLITSDHEFFNTLTSEQQQQFFKQSYEWLSERFGEKNIVSATVHLDERTPHMHFDFVPMTADGKLSAKEIFRYKTDLSKLHDDFYKQIGQKYGLERGEHKEGQKHLSVIEYKEKTSKEVKVLEKQIKQLPQQIEKLQENCSELEKKKRILEEQIHIAESHVNAVQATKGSTVLNYTPKVKKSLTGQISMSENDYTRLLSAAEKNISLYSQNERLKAENDSLKKSSGIKEIERLIKKLSDKEEKSIIGKIKRAEIEIKAKKFDEISKAIEYNPLLQQKIKEAINRIKSVDELLNKMDNKNRGR